MLTRRKFSTLNKIALSTMYECYEGDNVNLTFASQYGEFERLLKLINQFKNENEVSPISFSSSVHNASVGIFSLLNKITKPYNAISAGENTLSNGLIDAVMDIKSNNGNVLFCYADAMGENKSVSCLIGLTPREGSIKVKLICEACAIPAVAGMTAGDRCGDEFTSFTDFLKGNVSKFKSEFYSLERQP